MLPAKMGGMANPTFGRPSIFRGKDGGTRLQAVITPAGTVRFEQARARLAKLASWEVERVSNADVIEYLARGDKDTRAYIADNTPS